MAEIKVTSSEMRAKAEELRSLNAQFKTAITDLENLEGNLATMWEGSAQAAFRSAFNSDKIQMSNFYNAIEVYAQRLDEAANSYARAESTNVEIANTRSY